MRVFDVAARAVPRLPGGRLMSRHERDDLRVGQGVVYRPYPGAEAEDGEITGIGQPGSAVVMVRWLNGPQAGKVTSVTRGQLEAGGRR